MSRQILNKCIDLAESLLDIDKARLAALLLADVEPSKINLLQFISTLKESEENVLDELQNRLEEECE